MRVYILIPSSIGMRLLHHLALGKEAGNADTVLCLY